jgi:hypothetical protein
MPISAVSAPFNPTAHNYPIHTHTHTRPSKPRAIKYDEQKINEKKSFFSKGTKLCVCLPTAQPASQLAADFAEGTAKLHRHPH